MEEFFFKKRSSDSRSRDERARVSPALFIGLGGSGKEVLMRLRRLFYTNIRQTGLPICEYLFIDTDPGAIDITKKDYDRIDSKLFLPKTDMFDARVSPDKIKEYYRNQANYSHIFEWLDPSLNMLGPNLLDSGAGGMARPCGRLAFWSHYPSIRKAIEGKLTAISDPARIKLTQDDKTKFGFQVDSNPKNVFLIASIAGGTGSGMLLDTAFLLKDVDPNIVITGIIFLPSVFSKKISNISDVMKSKIYANGYAALMELDYFMRPRVGGQLMAEDVYEKFSFNWEGKTKPREVTAAPFHTIYLMGGNNKSNVMLTSGTEVFQMAAEFIHLEFCASQLGEKKRRMRSVLAGSYLNETKYEEKGKSGKTIFYQYYPDRYSSFGISLIKLDIDRRRNAAAYYLAKTLAEYWQQSFDDADSILDEVDSALAISDEIGKKWGHDQIQKALIRCKKGWNAGESMLAFHQDEILTKFNEYREVINWKFHHMPGVGDIILSQGEFEELNKEIKMESNVPLWDVTVPEFRELGPDISLKILLKKVAEDWASNIRTGLQALEPTGRDTQRITENANVCLDMMRSAFVEKFHELLAKPGAASGKAGIRHASEFCYKYLERLDEIEQRFVRKNVPSRECNFSLSPFEKSDELEKIMAYRIEGLALRAPLFKKTAVSWYDQVLAYKLKAQLNGFRDYLIHEMEDVKEDLLTWYDCNYYNVVWTEVKQIFETLRAEIYRCESNLDSYVVGLKEIIKREEEFFESFNQDYHDIRHHSVELPFDDEWYLQKVKETLSNFYDNADVMTWEMFLEEESLAFFFRHLDTPEKKRVSIDHAVLKKNGFKHLFQTICDRLSNVEKWENIVDELEAYCFGRMKNFLANTNVDSEFQGTEANERQKILKSVCKAADAWITPSSFQCPNEKKCYIGVPSQLHRTIADQAERQFPQFANADVFNHDMGNMVFYTERIAFPLFHLEELWDCKKYYSKINMDLSSLSNRHLDHRLIPSLRDIAPPRDQQEAIDLFESGLALIEALILGCCNIDDTVKELPSISLKMPQSAIGSWMVLGWSIWHCISNLSSSHETRDLLRNQADQQKNNLRTTGRNLEIEELKLAEYYVQNVFPTLQRAGFSGIATFHTNYSLICRELQDRLINEMVNRGEFIDPADEALWAELDKIDLEAISCVFPFKEENAQAELRVLKVT